jgi:triosephosphate isomerase (TIM)
MKYIIANWKANKNLQQTRDWLDLFLKNNFGNTQSKIILCPPLPFLYLFKEKINGLPNLYLGAQNISIYEQGTYTGETTALNLAGLADFVILGHSERLKYFQETKEQIQQKINLAKKYQLKTIYCFSQNNPMIAETDLACYEPPEAISDGSGVGNNVSLENLINFKKSLLLKPDQFFIYGGSVNESNAGIYLKSPEIDGVLVGGASLDPSRFFEIIRQA